MLLLDQDHIKFNSENKERFYADLAINYGISALEFFNKNQAIDLNEPEIFEMLQNSPLSIPYWPKHWLFYVYF